MAVLLQIGMDRKVSGDITKENFPSVSIHRKIIRGKKRPFSWFLKNLLCITFHKFDFPISVARVDDGLLRKYE